MQLHGDRLRKRERVGPAGLAEVFQLGQVGS
jgi:hypothetical protein